MFKPQLTMRDLKFFKSVFTREIARFLPGYECLTGPIPAPDAISIPLVFRGRTLGHASLYLKEGESEASPQVLALWPQVLESALDKVCLHKALITDLETGLHNRDYFQTKLAKLMRLPTDDPKPLKLWEDGNSPQLVLALMDIKNKSANQLGNHEALTTTSKALSEISDLLLTARLGDSRLGAIFRADHKEAKAALERVRHLALERRPDLNILTSFALYPQDLTLDPSWPCQSLQETAKSLMEKADTALQFSMGRRDPAPVVAYGELVSAHGLIVQILPQDRVLINLGRPMGALPGQAFAVLGEDGRPKGEITIFEAGEAYSLAHVIGARPGRLTAGDKLVFSRMDWSITPGDQLESKAGFEREGFLKNLISLTKADRPLTLAMARLDDHERLAAMAGQVEVDKRLDLLMSAALESENAPELLVNWGPATVALAWVGHSPQQSEKLASDLLTSLTGQAPSSFGLVHWPNHILKPESLIQAANKTLVEAAMTGPKQLIVFGPQTLNISGDHLFDEGDIQGAILEYKNGLAMKPALPNRINLLNSLGVCHGRLADQKAASSCFEEVIALDPENLMAHFNRGCSQLLSGQPEEAVKSFKRASTIAPDNFEVLYCLGKTDLELGNFERALKTLNQAAALKDRQGKIYHLLGRARLLSGDRQGALTAYKKAVKHNPDDADSLSSLGALFLELSNDQEIAISLFQRSVELDPTNSLLRQRLGKLLFELGDYAAAGHHLKLAVEYGCRAEDVKRQLESLSEVNGQAQNGREEKETQAPHGDQADARS
ncbi:MAG: tetratricopeptide repeat protein [Deltaproteobacteria bacterium]|jgi:tetratricopeptide (TPR) repeat protein|nr:tetratricopeptide repeat protein [Deltaproteobacteria bacterium]